MGEPRRPPPDIPDFTYLRGLGGGGFADVYLFRQRRPAREVAVKVLRIDELPDEMLGVFDREADLMASVSNHPYIVTIFEADQTRDGRPYLVMEFYPKPNYAQRARAGLDAPTVLQLGIQLAGAIETAHRAGVVHRDIKPANILGSSLDSPGLTDFGIAGSRTGSAMEESVGMSIPYSAPEVIERTVPGDEASDVYSLAATLYTLVARRTPFEIAGGDNSEIAIAKRVLSGGPPPTGNPIPASLEELLAAGLSRSSQHRPQSAREFGLGLQGIEASLGYRRTDLIISSPSSHGWDRPDDDDDGTRAAPLQVVDPNQTPRSALGAGSSGTPLPTQVGPTGAGTGVDAVSLPTGTVRRSGLSGAPLIEGIRSAPIPGRRTELPPPLYDRPAATEDGVVDAGTRGGRESSSRGRRYRPWRVIAAVMTTAIVATGAALVAGMVNGDDRNSDRTLSAQDDVIEPSPGRILGNPVVPTGLELDSRSGRIIVAWIGNEGDEAYLVARYDISGTILDVVTVHGTEAVLDPGPDGSLCVEVQAAIGTLRSAPTPRRCL